MWDRFKAACLRSLTIFWGYLQLVGGAIITQFDGFLDVCGQIIGDPNLSAQVKQLVPQITGGNQKMIGLLTLAGGVITILCRMRSIVRIGRKIGG